jgi:ferric-dicitrate binding protein FerR (iron transport regulator)
MLFSTGKYKRLIIKLLQGEATPEEKQQAEAWLKKSPANQRLYETYKGLLVLTESRNVKFDSDKAWSKLQARMHSGEGSPAPSEKKSLRQLLPYYAVAGIAAILLIAFGIFSSLQKAPEMKQISTLSGISAPVGLPDGTTAILNRNTLIKYPGVFSGDTREISIFGEAFFEVSPDRDKPFLIHTSGVDIKVVGTSFNVDARPGSDVVRVTVNTGKVVVYPSGTDPMLAEKTGVLLSAGEMATYSPESGKILRGVNDDLNVLSWKTGILTFRESRLDEVLKALENKYQTRFVVSNRELLNQRLTARFENESLQTVMETLSLIFGFQYEIKGALVILH